MNPLQSAWGMILASATWISDETRDEIRRADDASNAWDLAADELRTCIRTGDYTRRAAIDKFHALNRERCKGPGGANNSLRSNHG
jgi:hypothetical protein